MYDWLIVRVITGLSPFLCNNLTSILDLKVSYSCIVNKWPTCDNLAIKIVLLVLLDSVLLAFAHWPLSLETLYKFVFNQAALRSRSGFINLNSLPVFKQSICEVYYNAKVGGKFDIIFFQLIENEINWQDTDKMAKQRIINFNKWRSSTCWAMN